MWGLKLLESSQHSNNRILWISGETSFHRADAFTEKGYFEGLLQQMMLTERTRTFFGFRAFPTMDAYEMDTFKKS